MSDLDNKLDYILKSNAAVQVNFDRYSREDYEKLIPEIKQVFKNAGYVTPENATKAQTMFNQMAQLAQDILKLPTIQYVKVNNQVTKLQNLMTGQEWYDKYEQELKGKVFPSSGIDDHYVVTTMEICEAAAKKAAGIE